MAELKKVLSFRAILLITINSIMGTGIFFLPAVGARVSGPASILSWTALALLCIYISMCFGELTSMFPKAGGVYEFCKHAYGRFFSFIIGWTTFIAGNVTIAMLIVGAIQYLLPVNAPLVTIPICLVFIVIFNYIAFRGMKTSAVMLVAFAFITLLAILGLAIPGLFRMDVSNFTPFFVFPATSIFVTIFLISETFFGWETATFLAEETKDGAKVMPKALIWGTVIIAAICLLSVITSLGVINWQAFGQSAAPLTDLAMINFGSKGAYIFTLITYMAIIGSVAAWIVSEPRLILAMAKDKLFLKQFAAIHPKYSTPHKAILFQTCLTIILVVIGAGSYEMLLKILLPLVLFMYAMVMISVPVLRYRQPYLPRHYKVPLGKIGPYFVAAIMIGLIFYWMFMTEGAFSLLRLAFSFVLLGIPVYLLLELYYNPKAIEKVNDLLAYFALWFENLILPKMLRKRIIALLGNIRGRTVLELGCTVGTLTRLLAKEVGSKGKVIATDISVKNIKIASKRMKNYSHVTVLHHSDPNNLHPNIPNVDAVVAVGSLGYTERISNLLQQLNKKMDKEDKLCFLEYDRFFKVIPNIPWLTSDDSIRTVFRKNGFEVQVIRKKGLLWQHIYIYGKKIKNV
ncbi:amino acid permease [Candidatus Woesearchaeota archaeon]|nr:amino acid permease [Candidatus Woesearchaeota archaeon]MBW3017749.1 amino acid permease [Candidatus Woesearchaeota archaeon]